MNEAEWLACADPARMLYAVQGPEPEHGGFPTRKIGDRKLRLWVEACRLYASPGPPWAHKLTTPTEVERVAQHWCQAAYWGKECPLALRAALLRDLVGNPWSPAPLRWLAGRPEVFVGCGQHGFHPPTPYYEPCDWVTPIVLSLARAAYEERLPDGFLDSARLAVLSDALEEAGVPPLVLCPECDGHVVVPPDRCACGTGFVAHPFLAHLRSPGPHAVGCHVVDTLLGQE
jgi:hypothetical protein